MFRFNRIKTLILLLVLVSGMIQAPAQADAYVLTIANDYTSGFSRTAFKHWIDADKNGCDTRAEVLIEEAIVKPKIGAKCKLFGGKWTSSYDGKTITNAAQLDVDHLVPLAEAWRSGAWKWTPEQRQNFANDLVNANVLNAVSLNSNRAKGDKDPSSWLPAIEQCSYAENWVSVKTKYSLTYDAKEASYLEKFLTSCGLLISKLNPKDVTEAPSPIITLSDEIQSGEKVTVAKILVSTPKIDKNAPPIPRSFQTGISIVSDKNLIVPGKFIVRCIREEFDGKEIVRNLAGGIYLPVGINTELYLSNYPGDDLIFCRFNTSYNFKISYTYRTLGNSSGTFLSRSQEFEIPATTVEPTPTPTPTPTMDSIVTPGAFCSPAGAIGKSSSGVTYTCTTSPTDSRNRWRQ